MVLRETMSGSSYRYPAMKSDCKLHVAMSGTRWLELDWALIRVPGRAPWYPEIFRTQVQEGLSHFLGYCGIGHDMLRGPWDIQCYVNDQ